MSPTSLHSLPGVSHWLKPIRSQKSRELQRCISQRPAPGHRAEWTGMESGSGEANRKWSIYTMLHACVCLFPSAQKAHLTLIPSPCCLAHVKNSILSHQYSCPTFQFRERPMHILSYSIKHIAKQLSIYLSVSLTTMGAHPC